MLRPARARFGQWHVRLARSRLLGYHRACSECKLDAQECLVPFQHLNDVRQTVREALPLHPDVTAILARNDSEVNELNAALEELGHRVSDTMSLAGFDDACELRDANGRNFLTTVRLPLEEIGRLAAQRLIARVTGETSAPASPQKVILPVELVTRGSTAAPRP